MAGAEFFHDTIIETCKPDLLDQYRVTQRTIQTAIKARLEPSDFGKYDPTSGLGTALIRLSELPEAVANKLDPDDPLVKAGMLIGAVSLRAYVYRSLTDSYLHQNFENMWENTNLQGLASKCDEVIAELVPEISGRFVNIDIAKMHEAFLEDLHLGVPEHIVLTGLNAVGKSFLIELFSDFLKGCQIPAKIIKMPRPDGPLSQVIGKALSGNNKLRRDALQLACLSDALDVDPDTNTLMVFDRHPRTEAYVYGPPEIARTVLSTHEVFKGIYWTFIVDQHPMACALKVAEREKSPRIFEKDVETMTEQLVRFARLTALPGVRWINNDFPVTENNTLNWNLQLSVSRFIGSVFYTGVLQRYLLKQGKFNNYTEASSFLTDIFLKYQEKWVRTIKSK